MGFFLYKKDVLCICELKAFHFIKSQHQKGRLDITTVQESCTLLDTQPQQCMYKRKQVEAPVVFSQGIHTFLTGYHGTHTDKLISLVSVGL